METNILVVSKFPKMIDCCCNFDWSFDLCKIKTSFLIFAWKIVIPKHIINLPLSVTFLEVKLLFKFWSKVVVILR